MKNYKDSIVIGKSLDTNQNITIDKTYVTEVDMIVGIRGTGKSYAAGVIEEQMNKANWPFLIIDPLGIHCSLRDKFDDVVIVGGKYGDTDDLIYVERAIQNGNSVVVDLSEYDVEEQRWKCEVVCDWVKNNKPGPLKVIIEECDIFVPQKGGSKSCKDEIVYLVRKDRMHGIGMTLICQRFASVDKEVVTQVDNYVIFRSKFNSDVVELRKLFGKHVVDEVKELGKGVCYMDSGYYEGFVRFNKRECVHLGGTPVLGEDNPVLEKHRLSREVFDNIDESNFKLSFVDKLKSSLGL